MKTIFTITAALFVLGIGVPKHAGAMEADADRCRAYQTLADCDEADCEEVCANPDGSLDAECSTRCDRDYRRALRRPNKRYGCTFDTCDPGFVTRRVAIRKARLAYCEAKCEVPGSAPGCKEVCTLRFNDQIAQICEQAAADFCPGDVMEAVCSRTE